MMHSYLMNFVTDSKESDVKVEEISKPNPSSKEIKHNKK